MEYLKNYIQEKLNDVSINSVEKQKQVSRAMDKLKSLYKRGVKIIDASLHNDWEQDIIVANDLYCLKELEDALSIMEILSSRVNLEKAKQIINKPREDDLSHDIVKAIVNRYVNNSILNTFNNDENLNEVWWNLMRKINKKSSN